MVWVYTSACIRIVPPRDSALLQLISAIYIADLVGTTVVDSFCLSICHIPLERIEKGHKVYVSAAHIQGEGKVIWLESKIVSSQPILTSNSRLYEYIKYSLQNGFNIFPLDTLAGNSVLQDLNIVKVLCRNLYLPETAEFFRPFEPVSVDALTPIVIRSSPFNFTNASMFSDFWSSGSLNFALKSKKQTFAYLSDVKYLENMSGALVTTRDEKSVGLILGNLRKLNGDGDLLVIIPWEQLLPKLGTVPRNFASEFLGTSDCQEKSQKANGAVFPIVLNRNNCSLSWGSCILLNQTTLVTNMHVIRPYLENPEVECEVVIGEEHKLMISDSDECVVPFENLDLAFILLSPENQKSCAHINPTLMTFSHKLQLGDPVFTSGYGLLFNEKLLDPINSAGNVSSKVYQKPFDNSRNIPCMIVASSSCWNGSSGGGLFDQRGNLVGLICSNAQVFLPSVNGDLTLKTEKVPLFCLCIPLELILECYRVKVVERQENIRLNYKVDRAWKLESYHEETIERELKL